MQKILKLYVIVVFQVIQQKAAFEWYKGIIGNQTDYILFGFGSDMVFRVATFYRIRKLKLSNFTSNFRRRLPSSKI